MEPLWSPVVVTFVLPAREEVDLLANPKAHRVDPAETSKGLD